MTFVFIASVCIFSLHAINFSTANEPLGAITSKVDSLTENASHINIRKCCNLHNYYNDVVHECVSLENDDIFNGIVTRLLLDSKNRTLAIEAKRIEKCPKTHQSPRITNISDSSSYALLENGEISDKNSSTTFDSSHYCLELVGPSVQASALVLVYCLTIGNEIPKCCANGHYFDTIINDCSPISTDFKDTEELLLKPYISNDSDLVHQTPGFTCHDVPVHINLEETHLNNNLLCITKSKECYDNQHYCVDIMKKGDTQILPSASLCPINFINKCCPDKQSLHEDGCKASSRNSMYLVHILNTMRYKIRSVLQSQSPCTPIIIKDATRSNVQWSINSKGYVDIETENTTISTHNYCVDDFVKERKIFPVIKVCSEAVHIMPQVTPTEEWPENTLGKCCGTSSLLPGNDSDITYPQCVKKSNNLVNSLKEKFQERYNVSNLVFSGYPNCSYSTIYHIYELGSSYNEDAEITHDKRLRVTSKENNCEIRSFEFDHLQFCVEFIMEEEKVHTIAMVCAPYEYHYEEKSIIVLTFVGISCTALTLAFLSLIFVRVRRGMVTVKKINTLAGKILLSYVISQFVGFLAVAVASLGNFKETNECFLLAGFLMFFVIASFCWNTSICLEGLLLTMHLQMSDRRRYMIHSLWAWGVSGIITAVAIIRDLKRDTLPCGAITPKFGVERCFFSDMKAQLFYFYCPISMTVMMNGGFLIVSKIVRNRKLKKLEKDPNRQRIHENLKQAMSIKSIKSKIRGELSIKPVSNHSGLRTHHNRNKWIESLKLTVWSGVTWLMEVLSTVLMVYRGRPEEEWYSFLWYIPLIFNCLRGVGIFVIVSFTAENKTLMINQVRTLSSRFNMSWHKYMPSDSSKNTFKNKERRSVQFIPYNKQNPSENSLKKIKKSRSSSLDTIVTNISNVTVGSNRVETNEATSNPKLFCHSISQYDINPTLPNVSEESEDNNCHEEERGKSNFVELELDNISMENMFWEEGLQKKRDIFMQNNDMQAKSTMKENMETTVAANGAAIRNGNQNNDISDYNLELSDRNETEDTDCFYCTHL